ncbi:MAG TPA: N-acetyltransferase [Phycisphaerales bacterium]|nr:N-acetyltransferase [Phycisphaerales bacterium]
MPQAAPSYIIRPATDADVPAVLPMVQAICDMHAAMDPLRYSFIPDITAKYAQWLPRRIADPGSVLLVAQLDNEIAPGELAGFLVAETLDEIPIYLTRRYGFIHDLWVQPAHRRQGIAQELTRECLARFQAMNLTQVRLDTAAANSSARALFESLGFNASSTQMLATLS